MSKKVIISCAITGAMHTPTMSDYLPVTPEQTRERVHRSGQGGGRDHSSFHARKQAGGRRAYGQPGYGLFSISPGNSYAETDAVINLTYRRKSGR